MMYFMTDQERIKRLEDQIQKLTETYSAVLLVSKEQAIVIRLLRHYLEVLSYLLFKEDLVDRSDFLKRLARAQNDDGSLDDELILSMQKQIEMSKRADEEGLDGFMSKPIIGES